VHGQWNGIIAQPKRHPAQSESRWKASWCARSDGPPAYKGDLPRQSVRKLLILLEMMGCCYGGDRDGPAQRKNVEK
jgi:hypothetical protein